MQVLLFLLPLYFRYAALHYNHELSEYVRRSLGKQVIVVLNKCDIVPPQVAAAWKHYLQGIFLDVVMFTSYPKDDLQRAQLAKGLF